MKIEWDKECPIGFKLISENTEEIKLLLEWFDDHVEAESLKGIPSDSKEWTDCERVELEIR